MDPDKSRPFQGTSFRVDSTNDVRMRAARQRLAESTCQSDAIDALREIVTNLLGSEEIGLFQIDGRTYDIRALWSFGIEAKKCDLLRAIGDAGLQRVMRGECHVGPSFEQGPGPDKRDRAFVPIRVAGHTTAVLAILRLLPQKNGFDNSDMQLLSLLSEEAGKALFGSPSKAFAEVQE